LTIGKRESSNTTSSTEKSRGEKGIGAINRGEPETVPAGREQGGELAVDWYAQLVNARKKAAKPPGGESRLKGHKTFRCGEAKEPKSEK